MNYAECKLKVLADTTDTFHGWNVRESWCREDEKWSKVVTEERNTSYCFPKLGESVYLDDKSRSLEKPVICQNIYWAQDGTSFVTVHDDYGIRQYLVPELGTSEGSGDLVPFTRVFNNQSIVTSKVHPQYSLFNESESFNFILLSQRDTPLQLYPLSLDAGDFRSMRSFDVTNPVNGRYQVPHSIEFEGLDSFLVGFDRDRVSAYDIERHEPVWTDHSSRRECGSSLPRHIVSCFDVQGNHPHAGNGTRYCGTYRGELRAVDLRKGDTQLLYRSDSGNGYIQILRSTGGSFLYALKRGSNTIDVLDVRQTGQKVNELELPFKIGTQKFKADLSAGSGLTIGTDRGSVVNWSEDLIEFGGIDRTQTEKSTIDRFSCDAISWDGGMPYGSSRINLVQGSPVDPGLFLMSFSQDKFTEPVADAISGISLVRLE